MSNNLNITSEQDRRLHAYLSIELDIIEDHCRAYPLEVPSLYKPEERQSFIKKANIWSVQFNLLSRIKNIIQYSMADVNYLQIVSYLQIEYTTLETAWQSMPLPIPNMYSKDEKEDYLKRRELLEVQCNLLNRILKVIESCIISIK